MFSTKTIRQKREKWFKDVRSNPLIPKVRGLKKRKEFRRDFWFSDKETNKEAIMNANIYIKEVAEIEEIVTRKTMINIFVVSFVVAILIGLALSIIDPQHAETFFYLLGL